MPPGSTRPTSAARVTGAAVVACLALTSCVGTQDEAAGTAAQRLLDAVAQGDGASACAVLAPAARAELEDTSGKPCPEAVLDEDVGSASTPEAVEVYDRMAQVRFASGPVFLSRFDGEWLVVGAACTPEPGDRPYDCSIQVS